MTSRCCLSMKELQYGMDKCGFFYLHFDSCEGIIIMEDILLEYVDVRSGQRLTLTQWNKEHLNAILGSKQRCQWKKEMGDGSQHYRLDHYMGSKITGWSIMPSALNLDMFKAAVHYMQVEQEHTNIEYTARLALDYRAQAKRKRDQAHEDEAKADFEERKHVRIEARIEEHLQAIAKLVQH